MKHPDVIAIVEGRTDFLEEITAIIKKVQAEYDITIDSIEFEHLFTDDSSEPVTNAQVNWTPR